LLDNGARIYVVMGVAGVGKTTIGTLLARSLAADFSDADEFHSEQSRRKMASGVALTDEDRRPWLQSMRAAIEEWQSSGRPHVLACSALKRGYRQSLQTGPAVKFIYLRADRQLVRARLEARREHYMKSNMVDSQFDALEEPRGQEALIIDAALPPEQVVQIILADLA
jgi:gluconokinase